jgi:predicted permease
MGLDLSLRIIVRGLVRHPIFSLPAVLLLALTAGAGLAMLALFRGVLLTPLPLPQPDRLITVCERHERLGDWCAVSTPAAYALGARAGSLEAFGVGRSWPFKIGGGTDAETVNGGLLGPGFLEALGVTPLLGRFPGPSEMGEENGRVVVLSHGLWTERYGQASDAIGSSLALEGVPHTVIGVLPADFRVPDLGFVQLWRPLVFQPDAVDRRHWRGFIGVARLADGASLASAHEELTALYAGLELDWEEVDETWRIDAMPLVDRLVGEIRAQLWLFAAAVALFVVIGAANVFNLFLFRALRTRDEDAIRAALGDRLHRRVARRLTEGLLVGVAGFGLGAVFGALLLRLFLRLAPPELPRLELVTVDTVSLLGAGAMAIAVAVSSCVFAGALAGTRRDGSPIGHRASSERRPSQVRSGLVAMETALSLMLLTSAAVVARSFHAYLSWDPGFETEGVAAASIFLSTADVPTREDAARVWREVEDFARAIPAVRSAATVSAGPLFGGTETDVYLVEGSSDRDARTVRWYDAGPGYFAALGRQIVAGREITEEDVPGAELVAVVNETLARQAWPGESAVGRVLRIPEREQSFRVAGVVADVPALVPGEPTEAEIFWSNRQIPRWGSFVVVRTQPGASLRSVETALSEIGPHATVRSLIPLGDRFRNELVQPRFLLFLVGLFAVLAGFLAAGGLFAVLAVSVAERKRELGIRIALGATRRRVMREILARGLVLTGVGAALGAGLQLVAERALVASVPGVAPAGGALLLTAVVALLLVALAAGLPPAARAGAADPTALLRE